MSQVTELPTPNENRRGKKARVRASKNFTCLVNVSLFENGGGGEIEKYRVKYGTFKKLVASSQLSIELIGIQTA